MIKGSLSLLAITLVIVSKARIVPLHYAGGMVASMPIPMVSTRNPKMIKASLAMTTLQ
jgi:hypothetical protein